MPKGGFLCQATDAVTVVIRSQIVGNQNICQWIAIRHEALLSRWDWKDHSVDPILLLHLCLQIGGRNALPSGFDLGVPPSVCKLNLSPSRLKSSPDNCCTMTNQLLCRLGVSPTTLCTVQLSRLHQLKLQICYIRSLRTTEMNVAEFAIIQYTEGICYT